MHLLAKWISLLKMLNPEVFFTLCIFSLVFLVCRKIYKLGRRTKDADNTEEILDNVKKANDVRDRLNTDADYAARMSNKYRRK